MVQIGFKTDPKKKEKLEELAAKQHRNLSQLMNLIVDDYVAALKPKNKVEHSFELKEVDGLPKDVVVLAPKLLEYTTSTYEIAPDKDATGEVDLKKLEKKKVLKELKLPKNIAAPKKKESSNRVNLSEEFKKL